MFFVVRKVRKNILIEEVKKKEKGHEQEQAPMERPVYWCPRENRPVLNKSILFLIYNYYR